MQGSTIRRLALPLAAAALATLAVACGDSRVRRLSPGITRDSVLKLLAQETTPVAGDTTPNVYREERYLYRGQDLTVLMYSPSGAKQGQETVAERELTPLVLRNDTLIGWGWTYYDSVAAANRIQTRPRDK